MQAALLEVPGEPLRIDDIDIRDPGPGEVKVGVSHSGVCASDLHLADGSFPAPVPVVLGHEAAGIVEAVGPGVTAVAPGDHVVLTPCPPCGRCPWCVRGEVNLCVNSSAIATQTLPDGTSPLSRNGEIVYRGLGVGAFATSVITADIGAVRIPAEVPLDVACLVGCAVQTGVGAVLNTARVVEGSTVLVIGLGGVGVAVVQGARIAGASRIIASDPVAERREAALRFGATDVIDPGEEDVVSRVHALTEIGVDYAFEVVGRGPLVATAVQAARAGGTIVCVGAPPLEDAIELTPAVLFTSTEKKLLGCLLGSCHPLRDIPRILGFWQAGRLDLEAMVTARRPLEKINDAFADLQAARGIRTVIDIPR